MSSKQQTSKQRRQSQNRQQRADVAARREAAAATSAEVLTGGSTAPAAKSGSVLSRLTSSRPSSGATKAPRRARGNAGLPPGHRAALTSLVLAAVTILFVLFGFRVPISAATGEAISTSPARLFEWAQPALENAIAAGPDATPAAVTNWSPGGSALYMKAFWPTSLSIFLPLVAAALGFRAVSRRASAKVVNRAMYATLFGALLTTQLMIFFLPSVVAMAVASFQVRKAEVVANASAAPGAIEVDEVEAPS